MQKHQSHGHQAQRIIHNPQSKMASRIIPTSYQSFPLTLLSWNISKTQPSFSAPNFTQRSRDLPRLIREECLHRTPSPDSIALQECLCIHCLAMRNLVHRDMSLWGPIHLILVYRFARAERADQGGCPAHGNGAGILFAFRSYCN